MARKKLYIKTYGCQMNVYDSIRMQDVMRPFGYDTTDVPESADFVILNTCHIREKAADKVYSELGRIRKEKERKAAKGKKMTIAVAGCVAQAEGEEIFKRAPFVDIVVGPQSYQTLPDLVSKVNREQGHVINLEFEDDKFDSLPEESLAQAGPLAMVSIQEGCDKFCTFCVVPYTRGAEYSREVSHIYRETLAQVSQGAKEVTLLGQNVNAYHGQTPEGETWSLGQLITHLSHIKGLERIRYSTSHPRDMHEDLYRAHAEVEALMPFLNLPVQSGSNRILQAMNRKHSREEYFEIIDRLRDLRPDMEFSSDFIIGFPGETDKDFEDTLDLAKRVNFTQAYSFKYSPRPGTPGAEMDNHVPEHIKDERLQIFQAQINQQQLDYNQSCVGKVMPVLFDRKSKREGQIIGRSPYMQSVHIHDPQGVYLGKTADIRITEAQPNSLAGELVSADE
jgi:tRNA-2-methylthio-N6-dimethylallyladenosine synthase